MIFCVRWIGNVNGETRVGLTFLSKSPDLDPSSVFKFKVGDAETSFGLESKKPVSFVFSGDRAESWNQTSISGIFQPSVEVTQRYRFWGKLKIQKFHLISNQRESFDLNPKTQVEIFGVTEFHLGPDQTADLGPDDGVIGVSITGPNTISIKKVGKEESFGMASFKGKPVSLFKVKGIGKLNQFGEYFTFRQVLREDRLTLDEIKTIDCDPFEIKERLTKPGLVKIDTHPAKALKALGL